jgi:hypothetical protein
MRKDHKWLIELERHKHPTERNEAWANSPYGQLPWFEARRIFLPELGKNVGQTWFRIRELWRQYKRAGVTGQYRGDFAYQLNRRFVLLGLPKIDFPELEHVDDSEFEDLSQEQGQDQNVEDSSVEWSAEDALNKEVDDVDWGIPKWWFSD